MKQWSLLSFKAWLPHILLAPISLWVYLKLSVPSTENISVLAGTLTITLAMSALSYTAAGAYEGLQKRSMGQAGTYLYRASLFVGIALAYQYASSSESGRSYFPYEAMRILGLAVGLLAMAYVHHGLYYVSRALFGFEEG